MSESAGDRKTDRKIDVVIIGAGFSGLYALYRFREAGYSVHCFEGGGGVGGTWYWNRYPGAGSDIESLEYSYSFSEELQQEWKWSKRYSGQPEIERYMIHVADRFDLNRDISLNTTIGDLNWDESGDVWRMTASSGERIEARYCVMCTGILSAPKHIDIPGFDSFAGDVLHTSKWPAEEPDLNGKRVGIIGTGSSAVQSIPILAERAGQLTVFQRTPNYSIPLQNGPLDAAYESHVKSDYQGWRDKQRKSFGGYVSVNFRAASPPESTTMEVSDEERRMEFETRWASGGLAFYTSFKDLLFSQQANDSLADFVREKIRAKLVSREIADALIPDNYPILTKRLCADTGYYETFNRKNVELVNLREAPIERITDKGVKIGDKVYELDVLVFATGFDAITGQLVRMSIKGVDGVQLKDVWQDGPHTIAGLMTHGFPNMFFINGPQSCTGFFNPVLNAEYQCDWLADMLERMQTDGHVRVEAEQRAQEDWVEHVRSVAEPTLFWNSENWFIGANIKGKARVMQLYLGGFPAYCQYVSEVRESDYRGFAFGDQVTVNDKADALTGS